MIRTSIAAISLLALTAGCATAASNTQSAQASQEAATAEKMAMKDKTMSNNGPHIVTTASSNDFTTTLAKLQAAIDARGFKTFAVIDHAKGAASIDLDLRPTTVVIFGNPKGGTPLLQAEQTLGIELPLRALVYVNDKGATMIATTDMAHALHEFGVEGMDGPKTKIAGALQAIADEAGN